VGVEDLPDTFEVGKMYARRESWGWEYVSVDVVNTVVNDLSSYDEVSLTYFSIEDAEVPDRARFALGWYTTHEAELFGYTEVEVNEMTERLETITAKKLLEAARAIHAASDAALVELKAFQKDRDLRRADERVRNAYLEGVLRGLYSACREFEKRQPLEFTGSTES
jgi:hypothetical protein